MSAATQYTPSRDDFAALLEESFLHERDQRRLSRQGHRGRRSRRTSPSSISAPRRKGASRSRNLPARTATRRSASVTRSRSMSSASRTRSAKPSSPATRPAAKRAGSSSRRLSRPTSASTARSSIRSRAATRSISTAPWRSCRARQVDIRPVRDVTPLMGVSQPFQILKMDRRRGNIVVSRRTVLEESRAEQRSELVAEPRRGSGHRRRGQEHHRIRCVR